MKRKCTSNLLFKLFGGFLELYRSKLNLFYICIYLIQYVI